MAIDVDSETGVPLAVTVQAFDQTGPALDVEYTSFTAEAPEAATFDFEPPAGATVKERTIPDPGSKKDEGKHGCGMDNGTSEGSGGMYGHGGKMDGEGWDTVVQYPPECFPAEWKDSGQLDQMSTPVDGGRLIHTSLVNVLITEDGSIYVGSVPQDRLQDVAGRE